MHLRCGQFQWPSRCADAIRSSSPDAALPGLHRKPTDAAIGWLLAPYCPGGHQGINQHHDNAACTHFDGRFDGHHDAAVLYCAHCLMEEVRGFHKATKHRHRTSTRSYIINGHRNTANLPSFKSFRRQRWRNRAGWLKNLLGVWHIKGKPRTWQMHRNTFMGWLM